MGDLEHLEALQRRGAELVAMSEQMVVVHTRERASIHQLQAWLTQNPKHHEQVRGWVNGNTEFIALAVKKGSGSAVLAEAADLADLVGATLESLGTPEHGLRKSLCKVMSSDPKLMSHIASAWLHLGGLSVGSLVPRP